MSNRHMFPKKSIRKNVLVDDITLMEKIILGLTPELNCEWLIHLPVSLQ